MARLALLHNGFETIADIYTKMRQFLNESEYNSLDKLRGSMSQINCAAPAADLLNVPTTFK